MPLSLDRRSFLQRSAEVGGSLLTCSIPLDRSGHAAPVRIDAPVVDQIIVREITDNTHDIFLRGAELPGLAVGRVGFPEAPQGKTLESEWGLTLHVRSRKGQETHRYLLDFGFTPDAGRTKPANTTSTETLRSMVLSADISTSRRSLMLSTNMS
jgi:7,8-dihydropterin-6-yl-methyl-4-(beta-D-ribofuranosyl)aminobenzene 5'-phosphate synthase